jgi:uncharacterized protein (TIRG00374 family)
MLIQKGFTPGQATSLMTLSTMEHITFYIVVIPAAFFITAASQHPLLDNLIKQIKISLAAFPYTHIIAAAAILLLAVLLIKRLFWQKYRKKIKHVWVDFVNVYRLVLKQGKYPFLLNVFLSGLTWICKFSVITLLLMGFDIPTQPLTFFLFQWIILVIMTILPTPGGAGGAEAAFYFVFSFFVPQNILGVVTAAWRFITFYFLLMICSAPMAWGTYKELRASQRKLEMNLTCSK